jgi:hypothetical protein
LFREVEEVEEVECGEVGFGCDGQGDEDTEEEEASYRASVWAGRTFVTDWQRFLGQCEREGIARV